MRLRELRKLVEQILAGGGGAMTADAPTEISVNEPAGGPGAWLITLDSAFQPLGPIGVKGGRVHQIAPFFEAMNTGVGGDDVVVYAIWAEGHGIVGGPYTLMTPSDWPTDPVVDPVLQNFGSGPIWFSAIEDTDLYLLFAAADSTGAAPPSSPILVRNRHFGVVSF